MAIQVTGKNIEAGGAYQSYVTDRISEVLDKYIGPELSGHVRIEKVRGRFRTNCSVRLRTGLMLESHGEEADAYKSADAAVERLEKRLRRYKRRLKSHHNGQSAPLQETMISDYVLHAEPEEATSEAESGEPVVVAETERSLMVLSVGEAVMQLDLVEATFLVFRNAGNGSVNVVYRRTDGNIGWIDPTISATSASPASNSSGQRSVSAK